MIENGLGKEILDRDYIFEYCSRYLFTNEFINYDAYEDDLVLNSLKEGTIKDEQLLKRIIKNTDIDFLFEVFNCNFSKIIDMIENISNDELFRVKFFNQILNKIIDVDYYILLLNFIIDDKRVKKYLNNEQIDKIINKVINNYPTNLTDKQVLFLLNYKDDEILKRNIKENLKDNNFNDETKKILISATEDIKDYNFSFEEAISILDGMFKGNNIDSITCFLCLKAIIKEYLKDNNVKVYLLRDSNNYGETHYNAHSIKLNLDCINRLVRFRNYENYPEAIHILDTIFHEAKHILQHKQMVECNDDLTYEQFKENLLCQISWGYYNKNYIGINYEKEARVVGARELSNLLQNYFSYFANCIKYYKSLSFKEQEKNYDDRKIFELSDKVSLNDAIDKLVLVCPRIISDYPLLQREYNLDGSKKVDLVKR